MLLSALRWLGRNLSALLLAFILALVVWVSATISDNPNQVDTLQRPVNIDVLGENSDLLVMSGIPNSVRLTINAPTTIWNRLKNEQDSVRAWIDLAGLGSGSHTVPVHVQLAVSPAIVVNQDPKTANVTLEELVTVPYSVTLHVDGSPALGYEKGVATFTPKEVTVSGARSFVTKVKEVVATLDISNASQSIHETIPVRPLDGEGAVVSGVTINPDAITVDQPITLLGGYKNVIVKVITTGQVANGYKLTNIAVTPSTVVLFSSDPKRLSELPGYVETEPLDLSGAQDYLETPLALNLPEGISIVNDKKVLAQVSIAPIESNLTISLPVEVIGLMPGYSVNVAPATVDVILSGPLPVLNTLKPSDLRVVVDLTGKDLGTYQVEPKVAILPQRVNVESILPATLEVTIIVAPTHTPTLTPGPTSTTTVTPTPTKTR
jgi:YbbR domain-containing protein